MSRGSTPSAFSSSRRTGHAAPRRCHVRRFAAIARPAPSRLRRMRSPCVKHGRQALRHACRPMPISPLQARAAAGPPRQAWPRAARRRQPRAPLSAARRQSATAACCVAGRGRALLGARGRCHGAGAAGLFGPTRRACKSERGKGGGWAGRPGRRGGGSAAARAARRYLPNLSPSQSGHFSPCVGRPHVRQWRSTLTASYGCVVRSLRTSTTAIMMPIAIPIHTSTMAPRRAGP